MQPVGRTLSTPIFQALGVREDEAWVQARLAKVAVKEEKKMEEWIEKMKEQGIDWEVKLEEIDEWMRLPPEQKGLQKSDVEGAGAMTDTHEDEHARKDKIHERVKEHVKKECNTHVSGAWPFPLKSADLSHMVLD